MDIKGFFKKALIRNGKVLTKDKISKKLKSIRAKAEHSLLCPYCKTSLEQRPQRKKKCPHCKNYIFVKRRPGNDFKELVTEIGAKKIDAEWNKIHEHNALIQDLENYGITEKEFYRVKKQLSEKENNNDVIWSILSEKITRLAGQGKWDEVSQIYFNQALLVAKEGKNSFHFLYEAKRTTLLSYKQQKAKKVTISSLCCEYCDKSDGNEYTIDEAIELMPIPHKNCKNDDFESGYPWCRCGWDISKW